MLVGAGAVSGSCLYHLGIHQKAPCLLDDWRVLRQCLTRGSCSLNVNFLSFVFPCLVWGMRSVRDSWKTAGSGRNSWELRSVSYLLRSGLVPSCPAVGLASGKAAVLHATLESLPEQLREEVNDHVPLPEHYTSVTQPKATRAFLAPLLCPIRAAHQSLIHLFI